jgi:hypothetical protein
MDKRESIEFMVYVFFLAISHFIFRNMFNSKNTLYFLLHFFVNMYIVYLTSSDVVSNMMDPLQHHNVRIYPSIVSVIIHPNYR